LNADARQIGIDSKEQLNTFPKNGKRNNNQTNQVNNNKTNQVIINHQNNTSNITLG